MKRRSEPQTCLSPVAVLFNHHKSYDPYNREDYCFNLLQIKENLTMN